MMKRKWLALLCCMMLPASALAVTEGVVEDAPMVDALLDGWQADMPYLPDASYYGPGEPEPVWAESDVFVESERYEDGEYRHTTQNPRLTAGEVRRARKLSEDYYAGKATYTGESVLEKMDGVIVGVYALDPAEYDGEHAYVILPGTCLTDEQLLSIIAAYDEMGLVFDPAGLNYRNCSRGGGIETTRFFTDEEQERYVYLAECIRLGKLIPPEGITDELRNPTLVSDYFCGGSDFSLKPYRRMTDEEMVALLVSIGVHDERGEIDHAAVEARGRSALYQAFRCPLSMEFRQIDKNGMYTPVLFTANGERGYDYNNFRAYFGARFTYVTPEGIEVYASALYDRETGDPVSLAVTHTNTAREALFGLPAAITQEMVDAAAAQAEKDLALSGLDWHTMWEDEISTTWGLCIPVRAAAAENWLLTVYVGSQDGQIHGIDLSRGTLVDKLPELDQGPNG